MSKKKNTELSYDNAMKELQMIVNNLQSDSVSIDELAQNVKRASELIQFCREKLRTTENEIEVLNN